MPSLPLKNALVEVRALSVAREHDSSIRGTVKHRTPDQSTPDHNMFGPTDSRIFAKSYIQCWWDCYSSETPGIRWNLR